MLSVQDAILVQENGEKEFGPVQLGPPRMGYLCSGSQWWQDFMPNDMAGIAEFTDMHGIYLDIFLTGPCFEESSADHQHQPGGGAWITRNRMQQLQQFKAALQAIDPVPDDFAVAMEFVIGRFSDEVHIMHANPAAN